MDESLDYLLKYAPQFWSGLLITLELLITSVATSVVLSVPLALARLSPHPWLRWPAEGYSALIRGTPALVQIFLVYFGLGQFQAVHESFVWPLLRDSFWCAYIALSLNNVAYIGEVVRGGIQSVPQGEREAALALGMTPWKMYSRIILPRAFRQMLPAFSNEVIIQLKTTALASTVTLLDLTGVGRRLYVKTFTLEPLFIAGFIYILLSYGISLSFRLMEHRCNRWQKR